MGISLFFSFDEGCPFFGLNNSRKSLRPSWIFSFMTAGDCEGAF